MVEPIIEYAFVVTMQDHFSTNIILPHIAWTDFWFSDLP